MVLTGGGARGAYQAGVLRGLGRHLPELRFPIITGASAGAINAAHLAAHPGTLREAADDLCKVWENIEFSDVFRVDGWCLARSSMTWLARIGLGLGQLGTKVQGLLDTNPLRRLLRRELGSREDAGDQAFEIEGIAKNLEAGRLDAIALMTVNYSTGQTVSWVQGREIETWERPARRSRQTALTVEHVMASAALPLMFPAVELDGSWYGDGSIRMAAPLSPALHLGADRIFAISTQYPRSQAEADRPSFASYPPPAQIAGNLLNAIFLDVLDQDVQRLERLNRLLRKLPPEERDGFKPVDIVGHAPVRGSRQAVGPFRAPSARELSLHDPEPRHPRDRKSRLPEPVDVSGGLCPSPDRSRRARRGVAPGRDSAPHGHGLSARQNRLYPATYLLDYAGQVRMPRPR